MSNSTRKVEFSFTADEVNARVIEDGGKLRFLKLHEPVVDDKIPYNFLLREKVSEALPSHSSIKVHEGFKPGTTQRCYIKCSHDEKMPVTFVSDDLKRDHPLTFTLFIKCFKCFNHEETKQTSSTSSSSTSSSSATASITSHLSPSATNSIPESSSLPPTCEISVPNVVFTAPNSITSVFHESFGGVWKILMDVYNMCSATEDPEIAFIQNADAMEQKIALNLRGIVQRFKARRIPPSIAPTNNTSGDPPSADPPSADPHTPDPPAANAASSPQQASSSHENSGTHDPPRPLMSVFREARKRKQEAAAALAEAKKKKKKSA